MLPNVKISINEEVLNTGSSFNTFLPLVILKTVTGPIGTAVLIQSEKAFINTFGTPTQSTPEAYGMQQYIRNYGQAYIVRVAGAAAAKASGTIKSGSTNLITMESTYKTAELNGVNVDLIYSSTDNKMYLSMTVGSKVITSIKETIDYSTATADVVEAALTKIVSSFNDAQSYVVLTNVFVDKTSEDTKPTAFTKIETPLTGGADGNAGVTDTEVKALIEDYRNTGLGIDALLAPGFESADVVNKLSNVAEASSFIGIASISGNATTVCATAGTYTASSSLALYAGKVYLNGDNSIEVPACIAILPAYITRNRSSKWLAPAGVTRGTLTFVTGLVNKYNDSELEEMYINSNPVNGIKFISAYGYVVWGQKTALQDTTQYQDRINVVRLCKYLTKEIYGISYDYLFEPITSYTYNSWTLRVMSLMDEVKAGNGLDVYRVIMDDTINTEETKRQNKLIGIVRFKPLEAAEYIEITFVVTDDVEGGNA